MKNKLFPKLMTIVLASGMVLSMSGCTTKQKTEQSPSPTITQETQDVTPIKKSAFKLNTIINIVVYDSTDETILDEAFALCDKYEAMLSRTKETSEIYQLNQTQNTPFTLSAEALEVLMAGLEYSRLSNGSFDITVEPLTSLWNFGSSEQRLPKKEEIQTAIENIGYDYVKVDGNTVTLEKEDMGIDLGAIAKGYIADKMKDFLISKGVNSAIINLGGNVLCIGSKPDGSDFKIGIQKPFEDRNETIAVMELSDVSVVSSGIYERYFKEDGKQYHHILNPSDGYPYDNDLLSVTIISDKSIDGDALSTTCFSLGVEKGMELINSLENTYAVFITKDDQLHYSDGFLENIKTIDN